MPSCFVVLQGQHDLVAAGTAHREVEKDEIRVQPPGHFDDTFFGQSAFNDIFWRVEKAGYNIDRLRIVVGDEHPVGAAGIGAEL